MAYEGYLLKIGTYIFPHKYIRADSYSPYVNMQDLEPWTDANGYLHRNSVDLKVFKVEFETPAMLTDKEFTEIMSNISANYISIAGRTANVTVYVPEYDNYVTQYAYLADFTPKIYGIFDDVIKYNPIRFAFIGGLAND